MLSGHLVVNPSKIKKIKYILNKPSHQSHKKNDADNITASPQRAK